MTEQMRNALLRIRNRADVAFERYKHLAPRGGAAAIGSEDFEAWLIWHALTEYLRFIGNGKTCLDAMNLALTESKKAVAEWNRRETGKRTKTRVCAWGRYEYELRENRMEPVLFWAYTVIRDCGEVTL